MARYLAGDLHLGDSAVLEYTGRPFASIGEMNETLVSRWNAVVDSDDEVVFLGDLTVPSGPTTVRRWLRRLRGNIVFVAGDHDDGARRTRATDVSRAYRFEAGGYRFRCVHDPEDAHQTWDGWVIHGHHHDMRPAEFPFIDPANRRINVSVELLEYEPISVSELVGYLDGEKRLRRRPNPQDRE
jgi:calcineurin-like phosphoesterase family protein